MIQELFGENASGPLNNSSSTNTTTTNTTTTTTSDPPKLRCPRCDSSHTKFCYYNNYNLTQPRHFCKTCRRYWTKGGALRNVPIGGGCRKNKATTIANVIGKSISNAGRFKAAVSSELGKSSFSNAFELESNPNSNPIMWSGPPQTSHLLSLFRATTQNPNPNNNFTSNPITHMKHQSYVVGPNMGSLGFESLSNSLWRNNQEDHQNLNQHDPNMTTDQRLRSYYHHDESGPLILSSNVANTSSASSSTILDSSPVFTSGELGFWNQTLPWSDLAAANGAYP